MKRIIDQIRDQIPGKWSYNRVMRQWDHEDGQRYVVPVHACHHCDDDFCRRPPVYYCYGVDPPIRVYILRNRNAPDL